MTVVHSGVFRGTSVSRLEVCVSAANQGPAGATRHTLDGGLTSLCCLKSVATSGEQQRLFKLSDAGYQVHDQSHTEHNQVLPSGNT